jgi:hypothetical protein
LFAPQAVPVAQHTTMKTAFKHIAFLIVLVAMAAGCEKGSLLGNREPDSKIALESINLQGQFRLNSVVRLSWFGTDRDGYITGYEISFDNQNWSYTTTQDSTFQFSIPAGSDTVDINFYVRAIDDRGAVDPTPAFLRIPLKNSIPEATFDVDNLPYDTAMGVVTYRWFSSDPDGDETIISAEMRWNDGDWYSIDPQQPLVTFVADTNSPGQAGIYYGNSPFEQPTKINGYNLDAENTLYLRVRDIADAYSTVDTSESVYIRKPRSKFVVISGQPTSVSQIYRPILNNLGLNYDFLDFGANGGEFQPKFWSPTFRLALMQYEQAFIYTDASLFNNAATGQNSMLLTYMGQGVQQFTDAGRKVLVTTTFASTSDMSAIRGIYPIEDIVISNGQVRITNDSAIYPVIGTQYPILQPQNILIGIYPIIKTADAEDYYRAQLTKLGGWTGDNLVGVRRTFNGNVNHVFFGVGLHQFNKDLNTLEDLFEEILINDFNW